MRAVSVRPSRERGGVASVAGTARAGAKGAVSSNGWRPPTAWTIEPSQQQDEAATNQDNECRWSTDRDLAMSQMSSRMYEK